MKHKSNLNANTAQAGYQTARLGCAPYSNSGTTSGWGKIECETGAKTPPLLVDNFQYGYAERSGIAYFELISP
jgi:hypothetical protein